MLTNNLELIIQNYLIDNFDKLKINSKEIKKGDVFTALQGKNYHGNDFLEKALINGAKYIITDKAIENNTLPNILQVDNIFIYLLMIANKKRNKFNGKIIAITGSVGKTTLKENLKHFLSTQGKISTAVKSYNNYLGVLISLINMDMQSILAIFEIGTNDLNEIKKLSAIVMPHQVIITNIFPTHLENFKTTKNVAIEKSDLFNPKYNPNMELLILPNSNEDEIYLNKLAKKFKINSVITFGRNNDAQYCLQNILVVNNFLSRIKIKTPDEFIECQVSTSFEHQIINIMISFIIFKYNGLRIDDFFNIAQDISFVEGRGLFHELKIKDTYITLIDESYNASPISMKNCIDYFENFFIETNQRKILILGEMNELGEFSFNYHKEIVSFALKTTINKIIFCGDVYDKILSEINYNSEKVLFLSNELKIINFLENNIHNHDIILAKGSNSTNINTLVKMLLKTKKDN